MTHNYDLGETTALSSSAKSPRSLLRTGLVALATLAAAGGAETASACAAEPLIGSVCYMAGTYCPNGFVSANGQLLPIQQYQAAYAQFGTFYGGDGKNTFGVPDLRGRVPVGVTNSVTSGGVPISSISYGQMRGQETSVLQTVNLPPSGGSGGPAQVTATTNAGTAATPAAGMQLAAAASNYSGEAVTTNIYAPAGGTQIPLAGVSGGGGSAGGNSSPFTNLPPSIGVSACVAVLGIWPDRPN